MDLAGLKAAWHLLQARLQLVLADLHPAGELLEQQGPQQLAHPALGLAPDRVAPCDVLRIDFWNPRPSDQAQTIYGETRFRNQRQVYAIERRRKLIVDTRSGQERLFDLAHDPGEASPSPVSSSEAGVRLKEKLARYLATESRAATSDPAEESQPPRPPDQKTVEKLRALGYVD